MTWTPDSISPAMQEVLDKLKGGYILHARNAPAIGRVKAGKRYWLQRWRRRIPVERITVQALERRGLITLDQKET